MKKTVLTFLIILTCSFTCLAGDGSVYFDSRTGHKYVKSGDSYLEYNKKGVEFKTVNSDCYLLNEDKLLDLSEDGYFILYKKGAAEKVLPAKSSHPSGDWKACKVLKEL